MLSKSILESIEGFSSIVGREIAYRTIFGDKQVGLLTDIEKERLENEINIIKSEINENRFYLLESADGIPFDFSFSNVRQYGNSLIKKEYDSVSELLDDFYFEKDKLNRIKRKASDLFKLLNSAVERTSRKINNRRIELEKSENREQIRIFAELITANQYRLTEKSSVYELENYYDNNNVIKIPANPALSPLQNAQKYFKEYKKAVNAEKLLHSLIEDGEQELVYLDTVIDNLTRAETEREITEIRDELEQGGYVKSKKGNKNKKATFIAFNSNIGSLMKTNDFLKDANIPFSTSYSLKFGFNAKGDDWTKKFVAFSTWNEYGEGTYIMPSGGNGFGYLDAVRSVFMEDVPHTDVVPSEN